MSILRTLGLMIFNDHLPFWIFYQFINLTFKTLDVGQKVVHSFVDVVHKPFPDGIEFFFEQ